MQNLTAAEQRALSALVDRFGDPHSAMRTLQALRDAGIGLADERSNDLVVRWVNVLEQPTPPDADTIIRTITTTNDSGSYSTTHWLAGLRGPRIR